MFWRWGFGSGFYFDEATDHLMMRLAELQRSYSELQFAKWVEKLLATTNGSNFVQSK